jgi:hypothetical protein
VTEERGLAVGIAVRPDRTIRVSLDHDDTRRQSGGYDFAATLNGIGERCCIRLAGRCF